MVDGESEIDDPRFFFAKDGKHNADAELNATLDAFFHEERFDDNASACLFPARKAWLQKRLHIDNFVQVECSAYNQTLQKLSPTSVTLVFPAAHINSPASMFGHTFLRINSHYNSKLLAYAINYAADADPKKENGIVFAIKGLFGGYYGKYSLLPYYEKLKEYRDTEKRDIWEYDLNLTPQETLNMVRHIWELNGTNSYYYFFTQNCSYNMLWLMERARPSVHLREHFNYEVIPLESVHATAQEGLIQKAHYRPSKRTVLLKYETLIQPQYIDTVVTLQHNTQALKKLLLETTIPLEQKQYILEAALEYLEYSYSRNDMKKGEYLATFHTLSVARASLGKGKKLPFPNPQNPLQGHRALKLDAGVLHLHNTNRLLIGFRPAYHTLRDPQYGFLRGTQIEFLNTQLSLENNTLHIEELTLLSINSFAQHSKLFHPFSWRTKFGFDQYSLSDGKNFLFTLGAGVSFGNRFGYMYATLDPLYYTKGQQGGIGGSLGVVLDTYPAISFVSELSQRYYDNGTAQSLSATSLGVNITNTMQLHLQYTTTQKYHNQTHYTQNRVLLKGKYFF